jgi:hypothetical protein
MGEHQVDPVVGKVVIDFSRKYVSIYLCEGDGTIKDFDHFRYPFRLEYKEARQETKDAFDFVYQWANETINFDEDELQEDGESGAESG